MFSFFVVAWSVFYYIFVCFLAVSFHPNPCDSNHGCANLCLLRPTNNTKIPVTGVCACPDSYVLDHDGKRCQANCSAAHLCVPKIHSNAFQSGGSAMARMTAVMGLMNWMGVVGILAVPPGSFSAKTDSSASIRRISVMALSSVTTEVMRMAVLWIVVSVFLWNR